MAYGAKYRGIFYGNEGEVFHVDIEQQDYVGAVTSITLSNNPVILITGSSDDDEAQVIRPTTAVVRIESSVKDEFIEFLDATEREYRIRIMRVPTYPIDIFYGYLLPSTYTVSYTNYDYWIEIKAICALDDLKYYQFRPSENTRYVGLDNILNIIYKCVSTISGLDYDICEALRTYENSFGQNDDDSPLEQAYVYQERFYDDELDEAWNCYDVVSELLRPFGAKMQLVDIENTYAIWIFETATLLNDSFVYRLYEGGGISGQYSTSQFHTNMNEYLYWIDNNAIETYDKLYKNVIVDFHPGKMTNILRNGDFISEKWTDSSTPMYWTKTNSPTVAYGSDSIVLSSYFGATLKYITTRINNPPPHSKIKFTIKYEMGSAPTTPGSWGINVGIGQDTNLTYNGATGTWDSYDRGYDRLDLPDDWGETYNVEVEIPAPYYQEGEGDVTVGYYDIDIHGPLVAAGTSQVEIFHIAVELISESGSEIYDTFLYEKTINSNAIRRSRRGIREKQDIKRLDRLAVFQVTDEFREENKTYIDTYVGDLGTGVGVNDVFYYDNYWGGIYESDGTRTTLWRLLSGTTASEEGGYERIQKLLATKIKYQYTGFTQIIEGAVRAAYATYNPIHPMKDLDNYTSDGFIRLLWPVYTEMDLQENVTNGVWRELKYVYGSELLTAWSNGGGQGDPMFGTFSATGKNITSAIEAAGGDDGAQCRSNSMSVVTGGKYAISLNLTDVSGTSDIPTFHWLGSDVTDLRWGVNSFVLTSGSTTAFSQADIRYASDKGGNFTAICSIKRITGW